jgi:ribosomal protein L11 methyltransferase
MLRRAAVLVPHERAEEARALLIPLAPAGFEERETGEGVELAVYVEDDVALAALRTALGEPIVTEVESGWEDRWRTFHRPVRAGGVWVGPPWEPTPPGEIAVVVDPGRAFGTGGHPTTRAALELIARATRGSLLDIGCGSGVLAIAAAKLGFAPVRAVDNDPIAVDVTRQNATINNVSVEAAVVDALAAELPAADVAVANILLPTVESLAPRIRAAQLVTSGYYVADRPQLVGWKHTDRVEVDGWAADAWRPTP